MSINTELSVQMRHIIYTLGMPTVHLLNAGSYTQRFFHAIYRGLEGIMWQFMVIT